MKSHQLSPEQIEQLTRQGCRSEDWGSLTIAAETDLSRIRNVHFSGRVALGSTAGTVKVGGAVFPAGVYDSTVADCSIGAGVRIASVRTVLAGYDIEAGACIQDVGVMTSEPGAKFGNGTSVDVINEAGGRGVLIHPRLTAQVAYLEAVHRHDKAFASAMKKLVENGIAAWTPKRGLVGAGVTVLGCQSIRNVVIGPAAIIEGAAELWDGTINSCTEHTTYIGSGVVLREFIVAEGARIDSGAIGDKVFVGQGVKMGKQYSAENSVFFANCELFHGEGVSLLAGPYTVTHHKSTLMIAGLFSFYNAGSGTNQSNHMYKLGPVHQGIFERGCKTGSFSYVLFESHVGAFSVVIGKHHGNIRTPNLPFSNISEKGGESTITPALNLLSVGTVRDGEKWPRRDNRKAKEKRDLIIFDVFSPYTVEKMRRGREELLALNEATSKERLTVNVGGAQMPRVLLRKGAKYYSAAIARYLVDHVAERLPEVLRRASSWDAAMAELAPKGRLRNAADWTDIAGLLAPVEVVRGLESRVVSGEISSYDQLLAGLNAIFERYPEYVWQYVVETFEKEFGYRLEAIPKGQFMKILDEGQKASLSLQSGVVEDSRREFSSVTRVGYGLDLGDGDADADFEAVRGTVEGNPVVRTMSRASEEIAARFEAVRRAVESAP
jgi:hypothetical protein